MKIIIFILMILMSICIFGINYRLIKNRQERKLEEKLDFLNDKPKKYKKLTQQLEQNKHFSYDRINDYLVRNGSPYGLNVPEYIIVKMLLTIILIVICLLSEEYFLSIILGIVGFFAIDILIRISNSKDMKEIKFELADVYDIINIQTSAGVFIGDVLTDVYLTVKNKRFKKALMELAAEINMTKQIDKALDRFALKFDSIEIDTFVMTIKQGIKTGKQEEMLDDVSNSLKDMNLMTIDSQTSRIKRKILILEILMYIGILAIIIFGMYVQIRKQITQF